VSPFKESKRKRKEIGTAKEIESECAGNPENERPRLIL
jgi:hypothetical protein